MSISAHDLVAVANGCIMPSRLAAELASLDDRAIYTLAYRTEVQPFCPDTADLAEILTGVLRQLAREEMARRGQIVLLDPMEES